ncbi:hypothetical protein OIV83_001998 [Microbotryomycetes sp. JL201]|nr:hypothetical protein OIV83_001998 [Microbotryomycetes sp. JL201]
MIDFEAVPSEDIGRAFELESAGYPADEAASLESLRSRQQGAPELFLGAYDGQTLVGFVCGTLTDKATLTHDSMSTHVPDAPYVAIHSVCVASSHRRQGIALGLVRDYIARLRSAGRYHGALLIAHDNLIPLYQKAGFELVGKSSVVHGSEPWFEMKADLSAAEASDKAQQPKQDTLSAAEQNIRNPGRLLASFRSIDDLLDKAGLVNSADLFCPRSECRCLLLKAGAGKLVRGRKEDFKLPALPRPINSAPVESTQHGTFWSVASPLAFENIGFSRNAPPPSSSDDPEKAPPASIKYLTCADCDHGPLGWHDTEGRDLGLEVQDENEGKGQVRQGREFLLDVERVRYRLR